ncbi:hypothetical protein Cgig2_007097 [Carnegiea gigantea]|uniref:Uncharacterized protein n=1 Tax=Carnegiea gigantea TaxID=171969 RepID=A0A9Q1Q688_9CARY|nr:hypothetical protein Cgig2_007097 [Carnegiea gigantea]
MRVLEKSLRLLLRYSPLNIYTNESGNITKKKDFKSKDIHKLRDGERLLVQFNSAGQPIGDSRSALSRWIASLMKEPNLCPRDAKDFREVKENYGGKLLRNLWNNANARMESHRVSGLYASEVEIDKEVLIYFMGDDKPGRARLFGTGVTKSQVKRLHDGSLITRNDGEIVIDDATTAKLHHLQNVFVQQQNRMQQ